MPRRINVKDLRDKLNLTQGELAYEIWGDHTKSRERTIGRWENGFHDPSPMAQRHLKRLLAEHEGKSPKGMPTPPKRSMAQAPAPADRSETPRPPGRAHAALPGLS